MASTESDENYYIRVTQIIDPQNFWAQIATALDFEHLLHFAQRINKFCNLQVDAGVDINTLAIGQHVLVPTSKDDVLWRRAEILAVHSETDEIDVFHIDYGTTEILFVDNVLASAKMPFEFSTLNPLAVRCKLGGVKPLASTWISRATKKFEHYVLGKQLPMAIMDFQDGVFEVSIAAVVDGSPKSVADILVEEEVALATGEKTVPKPMSEVNKIVTVSCSAATAKGKIPEFNLEALERPSEVEDQDQGDKLKEEEEKEEEEDHEKELLTKNLDTSISWEHSDLTIGSGSYRPNVNFSVLNTIHDQIDKLRGGTQVVGKSRSETVAHRSPKKQHMDYTNFRKSWGRGTGSSWKRDGSPRDLSNRVPPPDNTWMPVDDASVSKPLASKSHAKMRSNITNPGTSKKDVNTKPGSPATIQRFLTKTNSNSCPSFSKNLGAGDVAAKPPYGSFLEGDLSEEMKTKLKNEYDWQSYQFSRNVDKMLERCLASPPEDLEVELMNLIYPEKSILAYLPGPKEFYLTVDKLIERSINQFEKFANLALQCLHILSEIIEFEEQFVKVMSHQQGEHCKLANGEDIWPTCPLYCQFLGQLYRQSWNWSNRSVIQKCVKSSLDKWILFNQKRMNPTPETQYILNAHCTKYVLQDLGSTLEGDVKSDMDLWFEELLAKQLDGQVPRIVRQIILDLLIKRACGWGRKENYAQKTETSSCDVEVQCDLISVEPDTYVSDADSVNTDGVDVVVEDRDGDSSQDDESSQDDGADENADVDEAWDAYAAVKKMLSDLKLDDLLGEFQSCGIRDPVLDVDPNELKNLLRECGFKLGHIMEIKMYIERKNKSEEREEERVSKSKEMESSKEEKPKLKETLKKKSTSSPVATRSKSSPVTVKASSSPVTVKTTSSPVTVKASSGPVTRKGSSSPVTINTSSSPATTKSHSSSGISRHTVHNQAKGDTSVSGLATELYTDPGNTNIANSTNANNLSLKNLASDLLSAKDLKPEEERSLNLVTEEINYLKQQLPENSRAKYLLDDPTKSRSAVKERPPPLLSLADSKRDKKARPLALSDFLKMEEITGGKGRKNPQSPEKRPFKGFSNTNTCTICRATDHLAHACPESKDKFFL